MARKTDVLIVGGGVIGGACAYYLAQRGAKVMMIDKGPVGFGSSYGNAGLILPSYGFPLPAPGALRHAAKWLLQKDSPLYIRPRLSWRMARWLVSFMRFANARHFRYATPALVGLALRSLELFDKLAADEGVAEEMGFQKRGELSVCNTHSTLDEVRHEMELVRALGISGRMLDEAGVRELEPAVTGPIVGGAFFENEAHAEPLAVVQTLARLAEQQGAVIAPWTEAFDVERSGRRIDAVRTTRGRLVAEQYVLAAGAWTPCLADPLGVRTPIQAGKGYAMTVDPLTPNPTVPMFLIDRKVAVTPREGSVRLAGTMELAGLNETVNPVRADAVVRGAGMYLNVPSDCPVRETWRGLRPCTPDGLPMIGRPDRFDNLVVAAGHAMLGLTLATGTGQMVADMLTNGHPRIDPHPFRPQRFQ